VQKLLIIVAHPDDEVLGCGGTVARFVNKNNYSAKSIILSKGMLSRGKEYEKYLNKLKESSLKANKTIGVDSVTFYNFPDNSFDTVSLLKIIKTIEKEIFDFKPDVIFTHYGNDLNVDHRRTFEAVLTACRPQPGFFNPEIYSFYIPSSSDWVDGEILKSFTPNIFFNIENYLDLKLKALSYYKTEMKEYPHSRSLESVKIFSQYWGNRVGLKYVEPFKLIRKII
jgi:LmbE family N-acetylglucosaminyl deacetylase